MIGLRNKILTATQGEAIINHRLRGYDAFKGEFSEVNNGAIVSAEPGKATAYAIDRLQDRGKFFIDPNEAIYEGQVIGENSREGDLTVNVTKATKQSNVRSSGTDDAVKIVPAIKRTLEEYLEYIQSDEYVEVTPVQIRIRKIFLNEGERKRNK